MRNLLPALLLALLVGCFAPVAPGPVLPVEPDPTPVLPPPPPIDDPAEPDPVDPPPTSSFDAVEIGMTQVQVVALVGEPTSNPPENASEGVDVVIYDRPGGSWMLVYRSGLLERKVWTPTGVVR